MGILTDFFVSHPEAASSVTATGPDPVAVPAVLAKSIDSVKVSTLFRIASPEADSPEDVDDPVDVDRPDGPWLSVLRDEVTEAIAGITDGEIPGVADAWAATEEWQLDHAEPEDLRTVVRELRDLARRANPPAERLYLWISL